MDWETLQKRRIDHRRGFESGTSRFFNIMSKTETPTPTQTFMTAGKEEKGVLTGTSGVQEVNTKAGFAE